MTVTVPFNRPFLTGRELAHIARAALVGAVGDADVRGSAIHELKPTGSHRAMLTHSCTAALEMAAILVDLEPGDEVIVPTFTFVSTANAFVLRGASRFSSTSGPTRSTSTRTQSSGDHAADEGDRPGALRRGRLRDGRDRAHRCSARLAGDRGCRARLMASDRGRPLGAIGALAALSFHETKNIPRRGRRPGGERSGAASSGRRTDREKGTNRSRFFRGQVDKYTWIDIGSSYLPGETIAALLLGADGGADTAQARRAAIWHGYAEGLREWAANPGCDCRWCRRTASSRTTCSIFFCLRDLDRERRSSITSRRGMRGVFHYVPLHAVPMGERVGADRLRLG